MSNIAPFSLTVSRTLCLAVVLLLLAAPSSPAEPQTRVDLAAAVHQALESNLDLLSRHRALAAAEQEVGLARSALLPQVGVGARAQILEDDRSDGTRGTNEAESILVAAELEQVLYDDDSFAGFQIQKFVYEGQKREFDAFRLGIVEEAALAYLDVDLTRRRRAIEERNRELTRNNRETSRSRIAAGWSSDREVIRWDVELAVNDTDVRVAQVQELESLFEFNRVRNRPPEDPVPIHPATVAEYGFVYANSSIAKWIATPEGDRRMRDYLVRFGLARSPDLAALDASISAARRQLKSNRRAFWLPTFKVGAGVDHLASNNAGPDVEKTEWMVQGLVTFPLIQGGAKFAGLDQAKENLESLRLSRRATAQSLEQSIRAALAKTSGSFDGVTYAHNQKDAAQKNFELVDASYTLGVASILDLLDAQKQLLTAELTLANAIFQFLQDVVAAQRALSFFAFVEPEADVEALQFGLLNEFATQP